jgi:hypothetical protein
MPPTNKILVAFVVADILFLISGAIELGFSIVVNNIMDELPDDGETIARNLLYQRFPLQGEFVDAPALYWEGEKRSLSAGGLSHGKCGLAPPEGRRKRQA